MSPFTMRLFGGFELHAAGSPLMIPTRKAQALLAYLSLSQGQAHPRDKLASLLWTEASPAAARNALRQTLFVLRKALGADHRATLMVIGDALTLPADTVQTDVAAFEHAVGAGTAAAIEGAAALYRGDLLAGLSAEAPGFEEWLMSERERLRELAIETFARLLAQQRGDGAIEAAVQSALRLLALDPLQETVHRTLMRLYAQLGRRHAALHQYQECVEILRRELAVEPEAETKALYRDVLRQRPERAAIRSIGATPAEPPLIGRATELGDIERVLGEALAGRGHVLAVGGEAGIGKSRLLAELAAEAGRRGAALLLGRAYESERILPFGPWIGAIRDAGILTDSRRLEGLGNVWRADLARVLPELADLSAVQPAEPADLPRVFEALAELLRHLALAQPLVILLEDCHWADDATVRFLGFFARRMRSAPILLALTIREEEITDTPLLRLTLEELAEAQQLTRLTLGRLTRDDTLKLVQWLGRGGPRATTSAQRDEQVWATSAGNPFVVIETMRAIASGVAIVSESIGGLPLPASVGEMIVRRLDRLSERARHVVRVAAIIGSEFEFALLHRAAGLGEAEAAEGVEELVRRRILRGVGDRFDFSHERIRDVVVAELLVPRRQLLHAAVAQAMEGLVGNDVLRHTVALGTHYREAGIGEKAVVCFRQAGRQATERCAYREAAALLTQARSALASLPESRATLEQAFEILLELRNALLALGEFPTIVQHMREAGALALRLGDAARRVRAAAFLVDQLRLAGEPDQALDEGAGALTLAETLGDPNLVILITVRVAQVHHLRGEYQRAVALFKRSLEPSSMPAGERLGLLQPPAVHSRYSLVLSLGELGAFAEGRAVAEECMAIAKAIDQPVALSFAWAAFGCLALHERDGSRAIEAFERALEFGARGIASPWVPRFTAALGYVSALSGRAERGLQLLNDALDQAAAVGMGAARPLLLAWLAEASVAAGDVRAAIDTAAEALALATQQGERGHAAWALRARAEAEARNGTGELERAARSYGEALSLGSELDMRPLVAQCRFGLGNLYARAGKRERARVELAAAAELFAALAMEHLRVGAGRALSELT